MGMGSSKFKHMERDKNLDEVWSVIRLQYYIKVRISFLPFVGKVVMQPIYCVNIRGRKTLNPIEIVNSQAASISYFLQL